MYYFSNIDKISLRSDEMVSRARFGPRTVVWRSLLYRILARKKLVKNALFFIKCVHSVVNLRVDIFEKLYMKSKFYALLLLLYIDYLRMVKISQWQNGCKLHGLLMYSTSNNL